MKSAPRLRVAINAQLLPDGMYGGVEQAVLGLVHALGRLEDPETEYLIITDPRAPDWLSRYLGPNQRVLVPPPTFRRRLGSLIQRAKRATRPLRPALLPAWRRIRSRFPPQPATSDGFLESLEVHVAHFPFQAMVLSSVPTIFNPWDLQHLHHPDFFPETVVAWREALYPAWCRHATAIATASRWTKNDLVKHFGIGPEKIHVIPLASATELYGPISPESLPRIQRIHGLPETFAFYPAQTWAHKNHLRLLEALALLRDRHGLRVHLVCTGMLNDFWPTVSRRIAELGLAGQVRFLGFVPATDLKALYRLAQFVVIPSLFEGWGFPLIEAFHEGAPVTSAATTSLLEYAADAALLFDATSVESIAAAVGRMATDPGFREELRRRGQDRKGAFSWGRTATAFRALYRKVAGLPLAEQEEALLALA